jgi:Domain of unknown function (DUF6429)
MRLNGRVARPGHLRLCVSSLCRKTLWRVRVIDGGLAISTSNCERRCYYSSMDIDEDKIDDAVLALLWLTLHERSAWKGFDWDTTDRLFKKGMITDPVNKSKSLTLTDAGVERSKQLFQKLFTHPPR